MEIPQLINGKLAIDDRGEVGFVNDFSFTGVKRFYTVTNHRSGFVRAWHAHKREAKYVAIMLGAMLVCCVAIDNWEQPSPDLPIHRFVLSDKSPAVLYIPAGYANGFMSLTNKAKAVFFSTATLDESMNDDIRFDAHTWNPWFVKER